MGDTQVNVFIGATTPLTIKQVDGVGTVLVRKDDEPGTALFLANDKPGKAGALTVLARLTAAVEALPDDTHAGQGVLTCPTCEGSRSVGEPGYTYYGIPEPGSFEACPDCMDAHGIPTGTAPVWRTLTFGDLRAGDVVKLDEDGDEETVRAVAIGVATVSWIRTDRSCGYCHNEDPVLVRHPRQEVGQ